MQKDEWQAVGIAAPFPVDLMTIPDRQVSGLARWCGWVESGHRVEVVSRGAVSLIIMPSEAGVCMGAARLCRVRD